MPKRVTTINRSRLRRWYRWIHRTRVRSKIRAVTNYVRGRSRLRSRPVPRNLSHHGESDSGPRTCGAPFFFRTTHPALRLACDGENSGSGSINRSFPQNASRITFEHRAPQIQSTTFEVRPSREAFEAQCEEVSAERVGRRAAFASERSASRLKLVRRQAG